VIIRCDGSVVDGLKLY